MRQNFTIRHLVSGVSTSTLCFLSFIASPAIADANIDHAITGSRSFLFEENNDHIVEIQKNESSKSTTPGNVSIDYFGHMAFRITSPEGITLIIDPWRNDPTGTFGIWYSAEFPEVAADIALSSHAHFDHDALYRVHAAMNLERMAGEFVLGDVRITGIADKHQCQAPGEVKWSQYLREQLGIKNLCPPNNGMSWDNVFYVIETGGMRIGFWGDNRPDPGSTMKAALSDLDVLIMNIDGSEHILSYDQVADILDTYTPKMVIPAHYLTAGAVLEASTLKSADTWVSGMENKVLLNDSHLVVNRELISNLESNTVYYFGSHYATE